MERIAFIEIYAANKRTAVDYFVDSWGFAAVAEAYQEDRHSTLLQGGHIQLVVSQPDSADSPVGDWLNLHGDGVADIAMYCDDVPAGVARAALAGLPVLRRAYPDHTGCVSGTVGGLGTIRHTLVQTPREGQLEPPGIPWNPLSRRRQPAYRWRPKSVDHVGICVPAGQGEMFADLYWTVFGLRDYGRLPFGDGDSRFEARILRDWSAVRQSATVTIVLAEPTSHSSPSPDGQTQRCTCFHYEPTVHHVAFRAGAILGRVDAYFHRGVRFAPRVLGRDAAHGSMDDQTVHHESPGALVKALSRPPATYQNSGFGCCDSLDVMPDGTYGG